MYYVNKGAVTYPIKQITVLVVYTVFVYSVLNLLNIEGKIKVRSWTRFKLRKISQHTDQLPLVGKICKKKKLTLNGKAIKLRVFTIKFLFMNIVIKFQPRPYREETIIIDWHRPERPPCVTEKWLLERHVPLRPKLPLWLPAAQSLSCVCWKP